MLRKTPSGLLPMRDREVTVRQLSCNRLEGSVPASQAPAAIFEGNPLRIHRGSAMPRTTSTLASSDGHRPAAVSASLWMSIVHGLRQRMSAVNQFLTDTLTHGHSPRFLADQPLAASLVARLPRSLAGLRSGSGGWTWLASTDLYLRNGEVPLVMDHNFVCPEGLLRLSDLAAGEHKSHLVDNWLRSRLQFANGTRIQDSEQIRIAILDSGAFSTASREDAYLAAQLGAPVVRNRDLIVSAEGLSLVQHGQAEKIELLIRRVGDDALDPNCFRPDSLNGVPGLVRACRSGRVTVLNAPGMGIVNNRAISRLIPDMIRHYLDESPILDSVATMLCSEPESLQQILNSPEQYSVRTIDPQHPARPYFGRTASAADTAELCRRVTRNPQSFVARPLLSECENPDSVNVNGGFNIRVFSGFTDHFSALPLGIGRPAQPDGGATLAIHCDTDAFVVVPKATD